MATYYINADTGNDTTGDGSQGNPWLTIVNAVNNSTDGDTIFCQNSTNHYLWVAKVIGNRIIQGESTSGVVFDGQLTTMGDGWRIDSTTINNCTFTKLRNASQQDGGFSKLSTQPAEFNNCIFYDNYSSNNLGGAPFWLSTPAGNPSYITFNSCLFYDLDNRTFVHGGSYENYLNINNCIFHFDNIASPATELVGGYGGSGATLTIKNTIFLNTQGNIITLKSGVTTLSYCCLSGSFTNYTDSGNNLFNTDPLFIDSANRNYNLSPSSPCIDAGTLV